MAKIGDFDKGTLNSFEAPHPETGKMQTWEVSSVPHKDGVFAMPLKGDFMTRHFFPNGHNISKYTLNRSEIGGPNEPEPFTRRVSESIVQRSAKLISEEAKFLRNLIEDRSNSHYRIAYNKMAEDDSPSYDSKEIHDEMQRRLGKHYDPEQADKAIALAHKDYFG